MSRSQYWRNAAMPYVELRRVADGRKVSYPPHSHRQWSIGAITHGVASYLYRDELLPIQQGDLVIMDPELVHSCNPVKNQPWGYWMMYIDRDWLAQLRYESGLLAQPGWQDFDCPMIAASTQQPWFERCCEVAQAFSDERRPLLEKQSLFIDFMVALTTQLDQQRLTRQGEPCTVTADHHSSTATALENVAALLDNSLYETPGLQQLAELAGCSEGHLIRSFRRQYGLTPHAYLINRRIQQSQQLLRHGDDIIDVAQQLGFTDQAHFQRTFKKLTATTPRQYQKHLN